MIRIPPRARRAPLNTQRSTSRFRVRFRDGLDALTGQPGTLVRASTSTALDAKGNTITVGYGRPRQEMRAWEGDELVAGLRMSTDDLTYPCAWLPETATILVELINLGSRTTGGTLYVGNDGVSGGRLFIDSDGTNYRATLHNGSADEVVTLTAGPATDGGAVLLLQLDDDGTNQRIRLGCRIVGGPTEWTAWSASQARMATFGTGAKVRLNRIGSAGTQGASWFREVAWEPGLWDHAEMAERL